jgi:hypothetical protein
MRTRARQWRMMTSETKSERRRLAEAAAAMLLHQGRRSLRALVRAERRTLALAKAAIEPHVERAATSIVHAPKNDRQRVALATIRRGASRIQRALADTLTTARAGARTSARESLGSMSTAGDHPLSGRGEHDDVAAHAAASSWSAAWATAATALVLADEDPSRAPLAAARARAGSLERIAATETASAFNDERRRIYTDFAKSSLAPELLKVWNAMLDRRTCAFCFGKDGQVRALRESFGETPPVHPNCRCVVEIVRIPRPERLEDVAIDYASFKAELRDVIRERREESGRHASAFLTESMGERRRSPVVLTGRFREARYVQR